MIKWIRRNRKIGLALGSGAALGSAHIGVLKAFDELNLKISYISGNSIGSVVASLFAFGKNWQDIKNIAINMNWVETSNLSISKYGLFNNKKLGDKIIESIGNKNFNESNIPLFITASDLNTGKKIILKDGNVPKAVMASSAIPNIFKPVEINDKLLADGGIVENVPISAIKNKADIVIGVNLNTNRSFKKPTNWFDVLSNTYSILINNINKTSINDANLIIEPNLNEFNLFDTKNTETLIDKGYDESIKVLKKYFF